MVDFLIISTRSGKRGVTEIYPKFVIKKSSDLMIRGGDFYAIWLEDRNLWSTDEQDALQLIDRELDKYAEENRDRFDGSIKVLHMWDSETRMIDQWHRYCQKDMRDNFHMLDEKIIFSNVETGKKDYASKKLSYPLEEGSTEAYDRLMSVLYTPEERHKIEWAIGAIITGDSKKIQKFMVLYGAAGTGKSTVLNIIQQLFEGYYSVFDAKALGSASNSFALEAFKTNPLVAIQHDGDLSRIEDNTRLNSLVSHELMTVNEKFKSTYANRFKCFLFMGTNKPVKITDAKSGLIRRLIDVSPSGEKLGAREYGKTVKQIGFELGAIAYHCQEVYLSNPGIYDDYIPMNMLGASNDFYNFVIDSYHIFKKEDGITLKAAWELYKTYCDDAKVTFPYSQRIFKEELKNYFREYRDRFGLEDGTRVRSYYSGFRTDKFEKGELDDEPEEATNWLVLEKQKSVFDDICAECPAQYANAKETPSKRWDDVQTKLSDLDTTKIHYVKVPENHIVIDFDIPGTDGGKDLEANLREASKWPPTYAELSKSGKGIHLHYIYAGDPTKLSRVYDDHIEVKVFSGKSSLRRKLIKCTALAIATISSGLPLKGAQKVINADVIKSERSLRVMILRNLNKEIHPATKPSVDFIYKILEDAYASGLHYDVTDMRNVVFQFAAQSTNNSNYCISLANKMKFKSDEPSDSIEPPEEGEMVFFDCEVFPNLFLINWKVAGEGKPINRMINPSDEEVRALFSMKLVGFNCRRYDNHMLYARSLGYSNEQLYKLSQSIIQKKTGFFGEAYNLSYTDIYDFASAANKMSLKKLEIKMGIHHQELGLPWDQPVPKERWTEVAEYCDNDVIATEAAFNYLSADWTAREILADLAGMTVNDTTNSLTTRIIFGKDRKPQSQFNYRNLALPVGPEQYEEYREKFGPDYKFRVFNDEGQPVYEDFDPKKTYPRGYSILPFFPGYIYERGKSTYRGEEVGEGGYVFANPGIALYLALLDIASMHPHSIIAEMLFGPKYTKAFIEIVEGRVDIKHKAWDLVDQMMDGKLRPYIEKVKAGEITAKQLANALKTAINAVYGLTAASFDNPFKDPRNIDNIVAKRGALFMINLKHEVIKRGFDVSHIKTDSIKVPRANNDIIQFIMSYGKEYGYTFEHEATYERMCLVNDAVYIARFDSKEACQERYGYIPDENNDDPMVWTATGTQFAVPYVFKTLFSHKDILFEDLCETKAVSSALHLDMNEALPEGEHDYRFVGRVGQFCPIKPGCGGGLLMRQTEGKNGSIGYAAATGSKGYRWLESEYVRKLHLEDSIDRSYYDKLVDDAVAEISKYGDFEWFAMDDAITDDISHPPEDELPW